MTTKSIEWPAGLRNIAQSLWADIQAADQERRIKLAIADPAAHRLSMDFPHGLRWRYYPAGRDGRGRSVWYCWSTTRNASGYFLGWREVRSSTSGRRSNFTASKRMETVKQRAAERAAAYRARSNP